MHYQKYKKRENLPCHAGVNDKIKQVYFGTLNSQTRLGSQITLSTLELRAYGQSLTFNSSNNDTDSMFACKAQ